MTDDTARLAGLIVAAVTVVVVLIVYGTPSWPRRRPCAGVVVETCKPALRGGWDHGPVVTVDRACKSVCVEAGR